MLIKSSNHSRFIILRFLCSPQLHDINYGLWVMSLWIVTFHCDKDRSPRMLACLVRSQAENETSGIMQSQDHQSPPCSWDWAWCLLFAGYECVCSSHCIQLRDWYVPYVHEAIKRCTYFITKYPVIKTVHSNNVIRHSMGPWWVTFGLTMLNLLAEQWSIIIWVWTACPKKTGHGMIFHLKPRRPSWVMAIFFLFSSFIYFLP